MISQNPQLSALDTVGGLVGEPLDLEDVLSAALDEVSEALDVETAHISLLDDQTGKLNVLSCCGIGEDFVCQVSEVSLGEGLAGRVAEAGQPLVVEDTAAEPQLAEIALEVDGVRAYAGVPLRSRGRVLGVMGVASRRPRRFSADDLAFLLVMAGQMGVAVENALLHERLSSSQFRLRERVKELGILYDVSREALGVPDVDALLSSVARRLPASMQYQQAVVIIFCAAQGRECLAWSENVDEAAAEQLRIVLDEGTLGMLLANKGTFLEYEISRLDAFWADCDVKSVLAVPIAVNGETVGSISVYYPNGSWRFLEEEEPLLHGISEQIAQFTARDAIERESRQRTQELSSLFEVSKALASVVELEHLLPVIEDELVETLRPAEAGVLLVFDEGTGMLTVESAFGYDVSALHKISLQVGESMSGKVFESGEPKVWATPEESASAMANMTPHNLRYYRQASGGLDHPRSATEFH
ncbi:MAG: hypothetical protein CEE40_01395 [Chloroflexi bacterium B3_Chlor]|nr:MAG: hypothetical protein CEE40_01395 [Chloroflexi bacterium B3_Chlor]